MSSDSELQPATSSRSESDSERVFDVLGHYRIIRSLGQGGMGRVYLATDETLRRTVALKVLRSDFAVGEEARARFFREARAAAALKHENIVTIYQVGEDQGTPYLVMEHLEGKSLEEWLRPDRRASLAQTFLIGKQIARGLAAAHKADVIHRDIKPANIWLESNGRIKILDFGLASHARETATKLTQTGALLGTPAYMSPEQARGESVDERSDLFSFGCVLYRMVTGRLPFQAEGIYGLIAAITSEQQIPARTINPAVPDQLSTLIDELLQKSREARPASAESVITALKEIEDDWREKRKRSPSATGEETIPLPQFQQQISSRGQSRWRPAAILLVLMGALSGVGIWFAFGNAPNGPDVSEETSTGVSSEEGAGTTAEPETSSTPEENPPEDQNPVDLLALVDLNMRFHGIWRKDGEALVGFQPRKGEDRFGLILPAPGPLPATYCLRMRVEQQSLESGALIVGLASGESRFAVGLDAQSSKKPPGFYIVLSSDEYKRTGQVLFPQVPVELGFWVFKDQLKVTADNQVVYSWKGDLSQLERPPEILNVPLFIGGTRPAIFKFSEITLEPNPAPGEAEQDSTP